MILDGHGRAVDTRPKTAPVPLGQAKVTARMVMACGLFERMRNREINPEKCHAVLLHMGFKQDEADEAAHNHRMRNA